MGDLQGSYKPRVFLICGESDWKECSLCSSIHIEVTHGDVCSSKCIVEATNCVPQAGVWDDVEHKTVASEWVSYILHTYDAFENK